MALLDESFSDEELAATAAWASFENLKKLEAAGHFRRGGIQLLDPEDPTTRKVRRGKVGGYRDDFGPEQVGELEHLIASRLSPTFGYGKNAGRNEGAGS